MVLQRVRPDLTMEQQQIKLNGPLKMTPLLE